MGRQVSIALFIVLMVAVIVAVDVLFFRNRFLERLMANVGIVLLFGAFYLRFLKKSAAASAWPVQIEKEGAWNPES